MLQWTQEEAEVQTMGSRQRTKEDGDSVITYRSYAKRLVDKQIEIKILHLLCCQFLLSN